MKRPPDQPHPIDCAQDCVATSVRLLDRAITGLYDEALRPLGLRVTQMSIMVVLARVGPKTAADVSRILWLDRSTLSRSIDRLIERGWIEDAEATDARAQPLQITREGRKLIDKAAPAWASAQEQAVELLGQKAAGRIVSAGFSLMGQAPP